MNYHGYTIKKHERGFTVTDPHGQSWGEVAPSLKIATKWVECDQAEKRAEESMREQAENSFA